VLPCFTVIPFDLGYNHHHHHHHHHVPSEENLLPQDPSENFITEIPIDQFLDPSQSRTRILTAAQSLDIKDSHHHHDFNMHGVFLHLLADLLGSLAVIFSTLIYMFVNGSWTVYVDPAISIIISGLIVLSTVPLVRSASHILLQITPNHLDIEEIKKKLELIPNVGDIHEFHIWQLSSTKFIASVHITLESDSRHFMDITKDIKECLHVSLSKLELWYP
jgi:cation diffusion facilitator family transporter